MKKMLFKERHVKIPVRYLKERQSPSHTAFYLIIRVEKEEKTDFPMASKEKEEG